MKKAWIGIAMFMALAVCGLVEPSTRAQNAANDNMTPYRALAADTLKAFQAHDMATAKTKARELESSWDTNEKALQKKSPEVWGQIDKAMDAFIKPVQGKSPDPVKVQAAYDTFLLKLQLAVNGGGGS